MASKLYCKTCATYYTEPECLSCFHKDNYTKTIDKSLVTGYNKRLADGFALLQASEHPQHYDHRWS